MDGFLVPRFSVSQDTDHVFVDVVCPQVRSGTSLSVAVDGCIFGFRHDPYYLPLVLPHPVAEETAAPTDSINTRVVLKKSRQGQHFEGLDHLEPQILPDEQLRQAESDAASGKGFFQPGGSSPGRDAADQSKLLASSPPVDQVAGKTLLQQVLSSRGLVPINDEDGEAKFDANPQTSAPAPSDPESGTPLFGYGLHDSQHGLLLTAGVTDPRNLLEVQDPASTHSQERLRIAFAFEEEHWDEGIYMDNYLDQQEEIVHLLRFEPQVPTESATSPAISAHTFASQAETLCLLVQFLFAFSYDYRVNEGEHTVESGWTLVKLCRSLTASVTVVNNDSMELNLEATVIGCIRRSLTVPLYRHWQLAMRCLVTDSVERLKAGHTHVTDCLLQFQHQLERSEDPLLLRLVQIWVVPLITVVPDDASLMQLAQLLYKVVHGGAITKENVGGEAWDLEVVELAAQQALDDGEGGYV